MWKKKKERVKYCQHIHSTCYAPISFFTPCWGWMWAAFVKGSPRGGECVCVCVREGVVVTALGGKWGFLKLDTRNVLGKLNSLCLMFPQSGNFNRHRSSSWTPLCEGFMSEDLWGFPVLLGGQVAAALPPPHSKTSQHNFVSNVCNTLRRKKAMWSCSSSPALSTYLDPASIKHSPFFSHHAAF